MKRTLLLWCVPQLLVAQLIINEVMFNPAGSEYTDEFVEVYNPSPNVMQINGWILSDGTGVDSIGYYGDSTAIPPESYALILDPGYQQAGGSYEGLIPSGTPLYTICTDGTLGSGGLSNSGEMVRLAPPGSDSSLVVVWTDATTNGHSLERRLPQTADEIWLESRSVDGTPGFENSVTPPQIDLRLEEVTFPEPLPPAGVDIPFSFEIRNTGRTPIPAFTLLLEEIGNGASGDALFSLTRAVVLAVDSSFSDQEFLPGLTSGTHQLEFRILALEDGDPSNDTLLLSLAVPFPAGILEINEIMYSPTQEQGGEWIEIFNHWTEPIFLREWSWSDRGTTRNLFPEGSPSIQPAGLLVLCQDTLFADYFGLDAGSYLETESWSALNTGGDSVRIYDPSGRLITSVGYGSGWGVAGRSLERRNPFAQSSLQENWLPSLDLDGGTPGRPNTRLLASADLLLTVLETHVLDGVLSGFFLTGVVQNIGLEPSGLLEARLSSTAFADQSQILLGDLPSLESAPFQFLAEDLAPGWHHWTLEILTADTERDTGAVMGIAYDSTHLELSEILFLPGDGQAEFLEFRNDGGTILDLGGWHMHDRQGTVGKLPQRTLPIVPGELAILTGDSVILAVSTPSSSVIIPVRPWPSLNNGMDSLVLLDAGGRTQFRWGYPDGWETETGHSMERRAFWLSAALDSNWAASTHPQGMTPGASNSVAMDARQERNLSLAGMLLDYDPGIDPGGLTVTIRVRNSSIHAAPASRVVLRIEDREEEGNRMIPSLEPNTEEQVVLYQDVDLPGWQQVTVRLDSDWDQYPLDDTLQKSFYRSASGQGPVLNEIMVEPRSGYAEWVELFNPQSEWLVLPGFCLEDAAGNGVVLDSSARIPPESYLLLTGTGLPPVDPTRRPLLQIQGFPTLNDGGDCLILKDPNHISVDRICYEESTPQGISLERILPTPGSDPGWGNSVDEDGHTAGLANSLLFTGGQDQAQIQLHPNPFSPDGDGFEDVLRIVYELPWPTATLVLDVYDLAGQLRAVICSECVVPHRGELIWDGRGKGDRTLPMGLYLLRVEIETPGQTVQQIVRKIYLARQR